MNSERKDLGTHEIIEYGTNEKGERVKIIKTIRRFSVPVKVYKSVTERKNNWTNFGKAAEENNNKVTYFADEDVFMEPPPNLEKIKIDENKLSEIICKNCGEKHWTRMCNSMKENKKSEIITENPTREKYVAKTYTDESKTTQTILIQNLSKDVKEYNLYELLTTTGCFISRILIPKDYNSGESRGMAFIDVKNKDEANRIVTKFNNHGLNYLRLKVSLC